MTNHNFKKNIIINKNFIQILYIEWEDVKVEHQWEDTWEDDVNEDDFYTQLMYFKIKFLIYIYFDNFK